MQTIGITGGTGFIGQNMTRLLVESGYNVVVFTRKMHQVSKQPNISYSYWSPIEKKFDMGFLKEIDAVIHLAGAGVVEKRWTRKRKEEIIKSRVESTEFLVEKIKAHAPNCKTLISASAIGYYGPDNLSSIPFKEDAPPQHDFLANTCKLWEEATRKAENHFRTIILRFGIVLGKEDGAFPQFANPQKFGLMPILGSGNQIMSWIHVDDLCRIILWVLKNEDIQGVFNAVAPNPVSQKQLSKSINNHTRGFSIPIYVPEAVLKLALGKMSVEVLKSATVSASKILDKGFHFKYPQIDGAVKDILL